jgi:hypothetical protein
VKVWCRIGCIGLLRAVAAAAQDAPSGSASENVTLSTTSAPAWSEPARSDATGGLSEGLDRSGTGDWLIAPIPFKSALLGSGLKLAVARVYAADAPAGQDDDSAPRESIIGAGGMYAEDGTWALAAFDRRYWSQGRWRTNVGLGAGELNYDLQISALGSERPLAVQQGMRGGSAALDRNFATHGWIGAAVRFVNSPVQIVGLPSNLSNLLPDLTYQIWALNLRCEWDTRSDEFFPESGMYSKLEAEPSQSRSAFSTSDYVHYKIAYNGYQAINPRTVLAWRAVAETVSGSAPFFALPWYGSGADLRGYSPGRYVGRSLAAVQAELRWQAVGRLGLVAFAGTGGVYGQVQNFKQAGSLPAAGVGLRWRLTDEHRINLRVDFARGRGDDSLLVSVGEAF